MKTPLQLQTNYVLVDYENVQPKNLTSLHEEYFQIYVFVGAQQTRLEFALADAMHKLGTERSRFIKVTQSRQSALDFYIAYYVGVLATRNADAYFHVISKDKGFDPLIEHLNAEGINAYRRESIADIPILNIARNADVKEKVEAVVKNLNGRGQSKPRKEKTLRNTIMTIFNDKISDDETTKILNKLKAAKHIIIESDRVSYNLPK